jgi:hypothetical protein
MLLRYTNCLITVLNNRKGRDAPSTRVLNSANTTVPAFNPSSGVHISRTQKVHNDGADFPPVEMDDFPVSFVPISASCAHSHVLEAIRI